MTDEERAELVAFAEELAGVMQSPWQPECIGRAFASKGRALRFTMQAWIDLDVAKSPLLLGSLPDDTEGLEVALSAFGRSGEIELTPSEAVELGQKMLQAIKQAFEIALKMRPSGECELSPAGSDGFGEWLPTLACLKTQLGMTLAEALGTEVGQAYALLAGVRRNAGWTVAGETYAWRDAGNQDKPGQVL